MSQKLFKRGKRSGRKKGKNAKDQLDNSKAKACNYIKEHDESLRNLQILTAVVDAKRSVYEERLLVMQALDNRRIHLDSQIVTFPAWQRDKDIDACTGCRTKFTLLFRRHHCRRCGKIFCSNCCKRCKPIREMGYVDPVRHCNECFEKKEVDMDKIKRELEILDKIRKRERKAVANPSSERILGLLGCYRKYLVQAETKELKELLLKSINCFMELPKIKEILEDGLASDEETKDDPKEVEAAVL